MAIRTLCVVCLCAGATGWTLPTRVASPSCGMAGARAERARAPLPRADPRATAHRSSSATESRADASARGARSWREPAAAGALALALALGAMLGGARHAAAENELAEIAGGKFDPSFVDKECFVNSCSLQSKACLDNRDCLKGMTCTAKCMGDNACITGCFAKFGNAEMNDLLKCSIEDHECVKIAVLPPGPEGPGAVPAAAGSSGANLLAITPPKGQLVKTFEPSSLEGKWYKVMGWNSNYDCFDCQANTFSRAGAGGAPGTGALALSRSGASPAAMTLDVDFSMPRQRRENAPTLYRQSVQEQIVFDRGNPLRHAHTEGHMFGLTFWENWSVIGENDAANPAEPPFKFIYYNGRTRQNTYEGAFVYARTPTLSPEAMPAVYRIAREAGMEPDKFCRVRNACFAAQEGQAPAFLGIYAAEAATTEDDALALVERASAPRPRAERAADAPSLAKRLANVVTEAVEFLEDPHASADWMFEQQQKVDWSMMKARR